MININTSQLSLALQDDRFTFVVHWELVVATDIPLGFSRHRQAAMATVFFIKNMVLMRGSLWSAL